MAALNFQEVDDKNMFNRAKFLQNGNCGYVLKPGYMTGNDYQEPNFEENAICFTIHLISGQHWPNASDRSDRIDENQWESSLVHKNGFKPVWNQKAKSIVIYLFIYLFILFIYFHYILLLWKILQYLSSR